MKRFKVLHTEANFPANNMIMPPLTSGDEAVLLEAMVFIRMTHPSPNASFKSVVCTIMLGHHRSFIPNISFVEDHEDSKELSLEWECDTFDALVSSTGAEQEVMVECLRRVSLSILRYPCVGNGFRHGIVGHVVRDPSKVVIRSGTTYEERTRWTICKSLKSKEPTRRSGATGGGGSIGQMSAGMPRRPGGSGSGYSRGSTVINEKF